MIEFISEHIGGIIGAVIGFVLGILFLVFGFWNTVLLLGCACIGFLLGKALSFKRFIPPVFKNSYFSNEWYEE